VNEDLIKNIVAEVLQRMGPPNAPQSQSVASATPAAPHRANGNGSCHCHGGGRHFGVFDDAAEACEAAHKAFLQLQQRGVGARRKVIEIVKAMATANAEEWGRVELEETKIGRLDHKIEKLQILHLVPGVEFIHPFGMSGDHGITMEEYTPFGVIGAVTPSTHSIPTLSGNIVNVVAAGNAIVFNAHPSANRCAGMAVRAYNEAIFRETGIENLACIVREPTLDSFAAICKSEFVRLLLVTGGPAVVKAAMVTGKRAICAGPGNPPVVVDESANIDKAAENIIKGAAYDNNLLCIGEKEVFVLDRVADQLMSAMERSGGIKLSNTQVDRLTREVFTFPEGRGAGCGHPSLNRDLIGRDAAILARHAGLDAPGKTQLLFGETDAGHPFVQEEQMMPFLPVVRVRDMDEAIRRSQDAEHNYRHTSIIHTRNVDHMTAMARAMDTTLFIKNGASMAGLGLGGEGYLSYSIATPTGEGVTNPKTFTRTRRCVMVDNLRIY
jgi:aldehyde dehydrogenase